MCTWQAVGFTLAIRQRLVSLKTKQNTEYSTIIPRICGHGIARNICKGYKKVLEIANFWRNLYAFE